MTQNHHYLRKDGFRRNMAAKVLPERRPTSNANTLPLLPQPNHTQPSLPENPTLHVPRYHTSTPRISNLGPSSLKPSFPNVKQWPLTPLSSTLSSHSP